MTYCLGLNLDAGVVLMADSRTNAGVDNISTFGKLFTWSAPAVGVVGQGGHPARAIALMSAGNLSITQEVITIIDEDIAANGPAQDGGMVTIFSAPSMFRVVERIGAIMMDVQSRRGPALAAAGVSSAASLIVAGQVGQDHTQVYLVYQAGNFIAATRDTPFMQIGEVKYGKPILDRVATPEMSLAEGMRAAAVSMAATIRSNLSVSTPLDIAVLEPSAHLWRRRRVPADDPVFHQIADGWGEHLRRGFATLPDLPV